MAKYDHAVHPPMSGEDSRQSLKTLASRAWTSRFGWFVIGIASLLWLLVRTGPKPSRVAYPCQRMAAANAAMWMSMFFLPILGIRRFRRLGIVIAGAVLAAASVTVLFYVVNQYRSASSDLSGAVPRINQALPLVISAVDRLGTDISDVYVARETNGADAGFLRLLSAMADDGRPFYELKNGSAPAGIIGSDDVVIIKVNAQWDSRGGTNVDLVGSIVEALINHPDGFTGEIIIADNGQSQYGSSGNGGSLDWTRSNGLDTSVSMADVARTFAEDYRVSTYRWDNLTTSRVEEYSAGDNRDGYIVTETPAERTGVIVSYPKFETAYGTKVSFTHGIWNGSSRVYDEDRLKVINVPVLKSHSIYGVTGAVKHYMGVVSDKLTRHNAHRSVGTGGMGSQMAMTRVPDLNILDAIWVNARPGRGPSTSYDEADFTGIIAAGVDPAALDAWAASVILMQTADIKGYQGSRHMDPADRRPGTFGNWLELSAQELRQSGRTSITDINKIRVVVSERK
ncbi:MAG: DUF362 domain-containing protein [Spirochaetaceae bacterium]|nr:DUF362 domain-containing protein [Spirochaetaceae bacterium]